jgi:hypothetical protein
MAVARHAIIERGERRADVTHPELREGVAHVLPDAVGGARSEQRRPRLIHEKDRAVRADQRYPRRQEIEHGGAGHVRIGVGS